ncbi:hypothetical protein [Nostoc flagelliforme]|uniref:hypothetical protein n=1 Tax=Nostoc flagelliforme TaxID=1306274 RepID=UPI0016892AEB|nr:hypothetical protein [Nostoc flagelliforme]
MSLTFVRPSGEKTDIVLDPYILKKSPFGDNTFAKKRGGLSFTETAQEAHTLLLGIPVKTSPERQYRVNSIHQNHTGFYWLSFLPEDFFHVFKYLSMMLELSYQPLQRKHL